MKKLNELKLYIDRPTNPYIRVFERMCTELTPYMTEIEIDLVVSFMEKITDSKFDINPSIEDSKTQLKLILGSERYEEIVGIWKQKNQRILSVMGTLKYKNKLDSTDKTFYDGLDEDDNPDDWEKVYV